VVSLLSGEVDLVLRVVRTFLKAHQPMRAAVQ
jgi:hypothetical protein